MLYRGIAQLVEYWSPKPWVVGSSPSAPAKKQAKAVALACFFISAEGLEVGAEVNDSPVGCQSRE